MIVCNINLFSMEQNVFKTYDDGMAVTIGTCSIPDLPNVLVASCYKNDTDTIRLYGIEEFINELVPKIYESNSLNYSNRKEIKVEVG